MSKRVIKEVEVKFTPAFSKAINGETPIKKTKKVAPKKAVKPKATAKPTKVKARVTTAKPKATAKPRQPKPRGYTITPVQRELTLNGEKALYDLFELAGPKMDKTRYFVDEASAKKYIAYNDSDAVATVALSGKGYKHIKGVISAHKDLLDAAELPELDTELPEKCDKTSIEDIDA
jgi:hypothetical protein